MSLSRSLWTSLAEHIRSAKHVVALTGAGVSKESGVPTFRDADGLWNKFKPEELASVTAFITSPERVWEWYSWRRQLMADAKPNPGHYALAELEKLHDGFTLITQNVDNLHRVAGSRNLIELHGNIHRNKCQLCGKLFDEGTPENRVEFKKGELPHCSCGKNGLIRPAVVWFGEMLPEEAIAEAWQKASQADIFLSIGTSTAVYPAAALPGEAKRSGAWLVEINPAPTELSAIADQVIEMPSGVALPMLIQALKISDKADM